MEGEVMIDLDEIKKLADKLILLAPKNQYGIDQKWAADTILQLVAEVERLNDLVGIEFNGCNTGDCPHEKQSDCDKEIIKTDFGHGFVPFKITGNGFSKQFLTPLKVIDFRALQLANLNASRLFAANKIMREGLIEANNMLTKNYSGDLGCAEKALTEADEVMK